jgi:hypothetical protein
LSLFLFFLFAFVFASLVSHVRSSLLDIVLHRATVPEPLCLPRTPTRWAPVRLSGFHHTTSPRVFVLAKSRLFVELHGLKPRPREPLSLLLIPSASPFLNLRRFHYVMNFMLLSQFVNLLQRICTCVFLRIVAHCCSYYTVEVQDESRHYLSGVLAPAQLARVRMAYSGFPLKSTCHGG